MTTLIREATFTVADTPANRKRAQQLIETFSEMWADGFPAFSQAKTTAAPVRKGVTT